jgi:predicted SprT family Zn-dependent metalloprotease
MMIQYNDAKRLATEYLEQKYDLSANEDHVEIQDEKVFNHELCWVFFYNSKKYIETKDFNFMLMGNSPLFVSKADGSMQFVRGDIDIEDAISELNK